MFPIYKNWLNCIFVFKIYSFLTGKLRYLKSSFFSDLENLFKYKLAGASGYKNRLNILLCSNYIPFFPMQICV